MTNYVACTTTVDVSISFGGKLWSINTKDMNVGQISQTSSRCLGAIFDLSVGTSIPTGSSNPSWVVGDTFLVRFLLSIPLPSNLTFSLFNTKKKNVYTVFRANPVSIGFAELSSYVGGSGAGSSATSASLLTPSLSISSTYNPMVTVSRGAGASSTTPTGSKSNGTSFSFFSYH